MSEENRSTGRSRKRTRRRPSTGARVALACLYVLFVIGAAAILASVGWAWASDLLALNKEYTSVIITVPADSFIQSEQTGEDGQAHTVSRADMDLVADQLEAEGLIRYKFLFKLYSRFSNADQKIVAGTYELNTEMDYRALVVNMSRSSTTRQTIDITIPEGWSIDQIFSLLEAEGVSTVEELRDMAAGWPYKWTFLQDIPLGDYHRLEGYLFPDTYTFYLGEDPKYILNKMLDNFYSKMEDYFDRFTGESQYSLHDIVIIASLIEKETDGEDYDTIASVLYNRLENPGAETVGYLQIDATLVYINGGRTPAEADKLIDSPYNTYLYQGLPAGPISNPGMASLYAAMNPKSTGYYFYALNPETNRHEFSRTFAEHQAKLDSYGNG